MLFTRNGKNKIWAAVTIALFIATAFMYKPVFAKKTFDIYLDTDNQSTIDRNYVLSYSINKGDTLWRISQNYGVSVETLQKANNLTGNLIIAGETLRIPQTITVNYEERRIVDNTKNRRIIKIAQNSITTAKRQEMQQVVKDDRYWLAKIIEAEAGIEPVEGKIAVGAVVLNRVKEDWFPDTIQEVIFHKVNGVYQFSPVGNGRMNKVEPSEEAYEAADRALAGEDPTDGALYFYNPKISKSAFFKKKEFLASIGNHQFFQ